MSSLEKIIKTITKIKKIFNLVIMELIGEKIANNKDLSDLIDKIIKSDPTLVFDIKKYISDPELNISKTAIKVFGRAKQIDLFSIISDINNLPEPDKIFSVLNELALKKNKYDNCDFKNY